MYKAACSFAQHNAAELVVFQHAPSGGAQHQRAGGRRADEGDPRHRPADAGIDGGGESEGVHGHRGRGEDWDRGEQRPVLDGEIGGGAGGLTALSARQIVETPSPQSPLTSDGVPKCDVFSKLRYGLDMLINV